MKVKIPFVSKSLLLLPLLFCTVVPYGLMFCKNAVTVQFVGLVVEYVIFAVGIIQFFASQREELPSEV